MSNIWLQLLALVQNLSWVIADWEGDSQSKRRSFLVAILFSGMPVSPPSHLCTVFSYRQLYSSMEPRFISSFYEELSRVTRDVRASSWVSPPGCPSFCFLRKLPSPLPSVTSESIVWQVLPCDLCGNLWSRHW